MTFVHTNGCFDIVHAGHVDTLRKAKKLEPTGTRVVNKYIFYL